MKRAWEWSRQTYAIYNRLSEELKRSSIGTKRASKRSKFDRDNLTLQSSPIFEPMLAIKVDSPPAGADWTFELKFDGLRAFAIIANGKLTFRSRKGTDTTTWFPELGVIDQQIASNDAIVDGEIILRDGSQQSRSAAASRKNLAYAICSIAVL